MKINFKSVVATVLFAGVGFVAQSSQAASATYTKALTLVNSSAAFDHIISGKGTSFVDHFTFTIGSGSDLDAGFRANQGKIDGSTITGFNLLNSAGNVVAEGFGYKGSWGIDSISISSGSYALEVIGSVTGSTQGSYAGTLNVSAVPEPETYGMMLLGLGLVGFAARRKAKQAAK